MIDFTTHKPAATPLKPTKNGFYVMAELTNLENQYSFLIEDGRAYMRDEDNNKGDEIDLDKLVGSYCFAKIKNTGKGRPPADPVWTSKKPTKPGQYKTVVMSNSEPGLQSVENAIVLEFIGDSVTKKWGDKERTVTTITQVLDANGSPHPLKDNIFYLFSKI
jgi:hypothetical protein